MNAVVSLNIAARAKHPQISKLDWLPSADSMRELKISDNGDVFDPQNHQHFSLNEKAATVLKLARQQVLMDDLLFNLCNEYDALSSRAFN